MDESFHLFFDQPSCFLKSHEQHQSQTQRTHMFVFLIIDILQCFALICVVSLFICSLSFVCYHKRPWLSLGPGGQEEARLPEHYFQSPTKP